jgi:hypothetical protein
MIERKKKPRKKKLRSSITGLSMRGNYLLRGGVNYIFAIPNGGLRPGRGGIATPFGEWLHTDDHD